MSGIASLVIAIYETTLQRAIAARWFWAFSLIFLLASCDLAWQDEHRNTELVKQEKAAEYESANRCGENARIEAAYTRGLEGSTLAQRQVIDKQQQSNDRQQADISSCVVSLGKLNPKVREEISVVSIHVASWDVSGHMAGTFGLAVSHMSVVFITTNEVEARFHGRILCANPFTIINAPQFPRTSQTSMFEIIPPHQISDREYEISTFATGTTWSPAHPAYMTVKTFDESPGECTFTPME